MRTLIRWGWLIALSPLVMANDLGVMGQTFEIIEVDMMTWIEQKLEQKQADGTLDRFHEQLKETVTGYMAQPPAVQGVSRATRDRSFLVDPTLIVPRDIKDQQGQIVVKAGTRVNPFEQLGRAYTRQLAFFDGRDGAPVKWAAPITSMKKKKRTSMRECKLNATQPNQMTITTSRKWARRTIRFGGVSSLKVQDSPASR